MNSRNPSGPSPHHHHHTSQTSAINPPSSDNIHRSISRSQIQCPCSRSSASCLLASPALNPSSHPIDHLQKSLCPKCRAKEPDLRSKDPEPPRKLTRSQPKKANDDLPRSSNDSIGDPNRFIRIVNSKKNVIDAFSVPSQVS